ncbi:unnamed protein product, partial [Phaeothamnion confervicola]
QIPQIFRIWRSKSCLGLSRAGLYAEVPSASCAVIYHLLRRYPFSAYGENCVVLLQNCAVVALLWQFGEPRTAPAPATAMTAAYLAACGAAALLPYDRQPILLILNLPFMLLVSVPQIIQNYRQGHTGTMAETTLLLKLAGSVTRVYTTVHEIGLDFWLLFTYGLGMLLSGVLLAQWYVMRGATEAALASLAEQKER